MLTVKLVYERSHVPEMGYKHTYDTIYNLHFQGITNNIYGFGRRFAPSLFYPSTHISDRPYSFLPGLMTGGRVST